MPRGATLFDEVARPRLDSDGLPGQADVAQQLYRENALLALVTSGYTPIPCMLYTTAGASGQPMLSFVAGSLLGRALRCVPIAALAYVFGPAVHRILRRLGWAALALVAGAALLMLCLRCSGPAETSP